MAANVQAIQAMQTQLQEVQGTMTSSLPDQINEAFKRLAPGLYADEAGNVMEVGEDGQVRPVNPENEINELPDMGAPPAPAGADIPGGAV